MKVYRKYKSKYPDYGTRGNGIWVSDDVSYSKDFPGDRLVEFDFDIDNANIADAFDLSHFLVDEDGDEIDDCGDVILDNYDDEFFQRQIKNQGYDCLEYDDGYCTLYFVMNTELLSKPQIIENMNKRTPKTINIDESQLNRLILKEDDDYPYWLELSEEYNVDYVFDCFESKKNLWLPLIQPSMYQKALTEFTKYGKFIHFPTKYVYQWAKICVKNCLLLRATTELYGHLNYFPTDDVVAYYGDGDYDDFKQYVIENYGGNEDMDDYEICTLFLEKKGLYDYLVLPNGDVALSDYAFTCGGKEGYDKIIPEFSMDKSPEELIVLINRMLDVYHMRGDLSCIFINGGSKALTQISDDGYLSEKIKAILPLKEEVVADGNAEHDIYSKKWKHQKDLLKDYICQNGVLMQSMENGKTYMVLRDDKLSSFLGVEYAYCVQYDNSTMKPSGTVYIRAMSTFRLDIRNIQFDTRGHDNMEGTADDIG